MVFPQGLWEQKIGSLLVVPTNLWEQLFPQRLWEHQMEASYLLFLQICQNRLLSIILHTGLSNPIKTTFPNIFCQLGPKKSPPYI